jgi:5-(carboxyamino)imidazole ribonucleotide mutase
VIGFVDERGWQHGGWRVDTGRIDDMAPSDPPPTEDPVVGLIMGSTSDAEVMSAAADVLEEFGVPHERHVVSAHRSPQRMFDYATGAIERGLKVIIAGAGGAAHLPGMVASLTTLPVIGVPIPTRHLGGEDSLLSIVQMPAGVPVATVAIGGARNAGLLAVRILALADPRLAARIEQHRLDLVEHALDQDRSLQEPQ